MVEVTVPPCTSSSVVVMLRLLGDCSTPLIRSEREQGSSGSDLHGKLIVPANHQAGHPLWWLLRIQVNGAGVQQKRREDHARLEARQRRADAVVNATAEGNVTAGDLALEVDVIRTVEGSAVAIGGAPQE